MGVRLVNNIPKVKAAINVQLAQGINSACKYWTDRAFHFCPLGDVPRDYGEAPHLKDTIRQTAVAVPTKLEGAVAVGTPRVYWAKFVNFGTYKMAAQPFWTVAALLTRQKFEQLMKSRFGIKATMR